MLITAVVLISFAIAQSAPDGPVPSIRDSGWDFPGLAALYAAHDPAKQTEKADGGWTWIVGAADSQIRARTRSQYPEDATAFWVTTVAMKDGAAHISERVTFPQGVISYARDGEKPYCYLVVGMEMDLSASEGRPLIYALYDQDGDGRFEELEEVNTNDMDRWVPRPRLGPSTEQARPKSVLAISEKGWRVPAGRGALSVLPLAEEGWRDVATPNAFSKSRLLESWDLSLNGVKVRGESIQTGIDSGWVTTASLTSRGVRVSRDLVHSGRFVARYFDPGGKIFCIRLLGNPWSPFGITGGLFELAFYDLDGDGRFEASSFVDGSQARMKDWLPLAPRSLAARK